VKEEEFEGYKFEAINNITAVKSLGIGEKIAKFMEGVTVQTMDAIAVRVFRFRTRGFVLGLYEEFFRLGVVLFTTLNVLNGNFKVGVIALVLLYFNKIEEASSELAETAHEFILAKISLMRMEEILQEMPAVELSGSQQFNSQWKKLVLKNVHFRYQGREVLKDISLTITRGEKIGIVGISGAGKSTLFKLLLKLYDDYEGSICYDDLALRDIKRNSYLNYITVVPQETELFNLSLKDNIVITGKEETVDEKRLNRAVSISHVKDFLNKLDNGLDTMIGEKGVRLSGGERQRVGIARALYRKPDILLLDEATSHLDSISERTIQDALHEFLKDVTAIIIAHRLSTLKEVDKILVIKQGRVNEQGTFDELLEKQGEFWKLWQKQKF
jgi:ABC-type multidrug transport system fused ATPase/permease subunit